MTESIEESNLELEELKLISKQLSDLYQYIIDKDIADELKEQEKLQNDLLYAENQIQLDNEQQEIDRLREEELLNLETEFRENLVFNIQELETAINKLPDNDFKFNNEELSNLSLINDNLSTVIEPVEPTEQELVQSQLSQQASVGIIFAVFVMIPVYLVVKLLSHVINRLLNSIF